MGPQLFGIEHILYIIITTVVASAGLLLAKKYAKTDKSQTIVLKILARLFAYANCLGVALLGGKLHP